MTSTQASKTARAFLTCRSPATARYSLHRLLDDRGKFHQVLVHTDDVIDPQPPDDVVDHIGDVIELVRQGMDILSIKRREEDLV